jgi:hypothetical protein
MYQKCPNCSEFKYTEITTGKWEFNFWNLLPYIFATYAAFGSPYYDTSASTYELIFGIPAFIWGFLVFLLYTPYLIIRRKIHNKKNKRNILYCHNCKLKNPV